MEQTSNGFADGLIMDLDPMSTPNNSMTSALNATLVTYNGNEYVLQNDMGNGRVETAYLPEGFVPVGTCSFGGIIYVASYNPLTGVSQMGCFPSPERNFGMELDNNGQREVITIKDSQCYTETNGMKVYYNTINIPICKDITLTPGDKFVITISKDQLATLFGHIDGIEKNGNSSTAITCAEISVGIQQENKVLELSNLKKFSTAIDNANYQSIFSPADTISPSQAPDLDAYRNVISSEYQLVSGSFSGTLCLIIKMKIIDTFSVKYSAKLFIDE